MILWNIYDELFPLCFNLHLGPTLSLLAVASCTIQNWNMYYTSF